MYRVVGDRGWKRGRAINISASGVLLQTAEPLALRTRMEMTFHIPEPIGCFQAGQVTRIGEVVRLGPSTRAMPFPTAARFVEVRREELTTRVMGHDDAASRP